MIPPPHLYIFSRARTLTLKIEGFEKRGPSRKNLFAVPLDQLGIGERPQKDSGRSSSTAPGCRGSAPRPGLPCSVIRRPTPCLNLSTAWGTVYSMNGSSPLAAICSARASRTGSVGTRKGSRVITTSSSALPLDVDPLPEGIGAEQDRVPLLSEAGEEKVPVGLPLAHGGEAQPFQAAPAGGQRPGSAGRRR